MARRGARTRGEKVIDNVFWSGALADFGSVALSAGTVAEQALVASNQPFTLMRIRGNLLAYIDGGPAPGVSAEIGVGLRMVPEGTGSTVLSSPISDDEASWIYYSTFVVGHEEPVTDVLQIPGLTYFREVMDGKAMRRVKPDTELQWVAENVTLGGAVSVNILIACRFLLGN